MIEYEANVFFGVLVDSGTAEEVSRKLGDEAELYLHNLSGYCSDSDGDIVLGMELMNVDDGAKPFPDRNTMESCKKFVRILLKKLDLGQYEPQLILGLRVC